MISPVVSEGFLFICTPRGCSALVRVLETNDVVDVDEVTGFVGVEACGDVGFIAMVVEVFAIVTLCNDN
ncbi:MAG: hypothetical protein ACI9W7_001226 [Porticoccaceae bacterium]|jgi:hypothetical protein|tara:strand:+ start:220 stop:426 length:207 start_codon:yes stop_codon:yes gene_type:complete